MFDHLFENRNRTVTHLLKLSDCLGRSLRENVELFAIDSDKGEVAFLAESGKVITGDFSIDESINLEGIKVQSMQVFTDDKTFDNMIEESVSSLLDNLNFDNYGEAEESFSDILSLWESRLKFDNVKKRLDEKISVFSEDQNIIETQEFQRFLEVMPQFQKFLSENREEISSVKEIENAIKLSNSVSQAFNFPRVSFDDLHEGTYKVSRGINESVYDLLCKQELVRKELLESKKSFETVWATNAKVRNLATEIFQKDQDVVLESLVECVVDIPFLALTTKKQLFECIDNALGLSDQETITEKDIKKFASKLFEMKKPMKSFVIDLLNDKYGINVQNLKEGATFSNLASTQVVIFESLYRLAPKGSVIKECLQGLSKMLKSKNGVEVIDVNDIIQESFLECGYEFDYDILIESLSFDEIFSEASTSQDLLENAKKLLLDKKKKKEEEGGEEEGDDGDVEVHVDVNSHKDEPNDDEGMEDVPDQEKTKEAEKEEKKEDGDKGKEDDSERADEAVESEQEPLMDPQEAEPELEEEPPLDKQGFLNAMEDLGSLSDMLGEPAEDEE